MKLYSLQEAAAVLKVTRQTMYNWIRAGRLTATKIGREYRLTEDQVLEIIQNGVKAAK